MRLTARVRVIRILMLLAIGSVLNLGVAWICVWNSLSSESTDDWSSEALRSSWSHRVPQGWPRLTSWSSDATFGYESIHAWDATSWEPTFGVAALSFKHSLTIEHAGWPFKAFESEQRIPSVAEDRMHAEGQPWAFSWRTGLGLGSNASMFLSGTLLWFPVRPLWPGWIANTALFAGMIWACSRTPRLFRTIYRRRRGLCTVCGYAVAALDRCPECGTAVTRARGVL